MEPMVGKYRLGIIKSTEPSVRKTASALAASAVRRIVPAFPGS